MVYAYALITYATHFPVHVASKLKSDAGTMSAPGIPVKELTAPLGLPSLKELEILRLTSMRHQEFCCLQDTKGL